MSDELARVLAEHPWRPNWWRCGRTCEWVPNGDMHVTAQHTEHLADITLAWFAGRPSAPPVTTDAVLAMCERTRREMDDVLDTLAALGIEVQP